MTRHYRSDNEEGGMQVEPHPQEEPQAQQEEDVPSIEVEIPRVTADLGNDLFFVKLPNFLSIETRWVWLVGGVYLFYQSGRLMLVCMRTRVTMIAMCWTKTVGPVWNWKLRIRSDGGRESTKTGKKWKRATHVLYAGAMGGGPLSHWSFDSDINVFFLACHYIWVAKYLIFIVSHCKENIVTCL